MSLSTNIRRQFADYAPQHFGFSLADKVATVTLNRPDRKNPLTFGSYAELLERFRGLQYAQDVKAVVMTGAGGNFRSGSDVHEIIGPLLAMDIPELLEFTRMTGDLVLAIRRCPQPVIAAVDGIARRWCSPRRPSTGRWRRARGSSTCPRCERACRPARRCPMQHVSSGSRPQAL
jgi:1,4-dihydroxy-2-naphthoyl-CoA synthase